MIELFKPILILVAAVLGVGLFCGLWGILLDKIFGEDR